MVKLWDLLSRDCCLPGMCSTQQLKDASTSRLQKHSDLVYSMKYYGLITQHITGHRQNPVPMGLVSDYIMLDQSTTEVRFRFYLEGH